jgi:hypothetical protein
VINYRSVLVFFELPRKRVIPAKTVFIEIGEHMFENDGKNIVWNDHPSQVPQPTIEAGNKIRKIIFILNVNFYKPIFVSFGEKYIFELLSNVNFFIMLIQ